MDLSHGRPGPARAWLLATAVVCCGLAACGSPTLAPTPDGGPVQGTDKLVPQDGTEVGLAFGNAAVLRVLYMDADGNPRPGRRLEFALVGDARGSTLSAPASLTDGAGVASVEVRAGRNETTFEVSASHADAGSVAFVLSVNESGEFAMLKVRAAVPSELTVSGALSVLLYDHDLDGVTCATLPAFSPPPATRTKLADTPAKEVSFGPLLASRDYAVLVIPAVSGVPDTVGCVDLLRGRLISGATVLALVPLHRLLATPAASYQVTSRLPVGALDQVTGAFAPLACPQAPADLFLDCLVDARTTAAGDALDCVPSSADLAEAVGLALNSHRGSVLTDGCRDENIVPGVLSPSLEKVLRDLLAAHAPAATQALVTASRPEAVAHALAEVTISSDLRLAATPAPDRWVAVHLLQRATFADAQGANSFAVDLTTQGLPLATVADIPLTLSATGDLTIAAHELSLRFGSLARRAAGALLFQPAGLPGDSEGLVAVFTVALAEGHAGACAGLAALLCPAAGLPQDCLGATCPQALAALPAAFDARLVAFDGGADLQLAGNARPTATTGPVADYLTAGHWEVGLGPTASRTPFVATFSATPAPATLHHTGGEWTTSSP